MRKKTSKRKQAGGLRPKSAPVHNIKKVTATRSNGPASVGVGFGKSLRTHAIARPGYPTGTFAV